MSRSAPILPYRVLSADIIVPSSAEWTVVVGGQRRGGLVDGAAFPDWDAELAFRLERTFRVERDIAMELGVESPSSCCDLVVTGTTGGGLRRDVLFRAPVPKGGWSDLEVSVEPPGQRLARDLTLTTGVYLSRDIRSRDPLAPKIAGSRLWEMSERFRLEGGAARLPMYDIAFSKAFPGDGIDFADFHVEIADDPDLEIASALIVYLNSERPDFIKEIGVAGSPAERRLWSGVIRQVITTAILSSELLTGTPGESNGLAATVQRWMHQVWSTLPLESIRKLPEGGFSRFEAQIDSWLNDIENREKAKVRK